MQQKIGQCGECNKSRPLNSKGNCSECQFIINHNGKTRQEVYLEREMEREKNKPKKTHTLKRKPLNPLKKQQKNTGELGVFKEIWEERDHICENKNCRCELGDELNIQFFSHRRSKGAAPELRLVKSNIDLLCVKCHYEYEFKDRSKIVI